MIPALIGTLITSGLTSLGGSLMDTLVDKGKDVVQDKIKDITGLDLDLDKSLTPEQVGTIEGHSDQLMMALEQTREANRHEEAAAKIALQEAELEFEDTKDARKMGTGLMNKDKDDILRYFIPVYTIIVYITGLFMIGVIIFGNLDGLVRDLAMMVIGAILTWIGGLNHYWFGTGNSSAKKDAKINSMVHGNNPKDIVGNITEDIVEYGADKAEEMIKDVF